MKITPTSIPEVLIIEPRVFEDGRGFFFESYRRDIFREHGIHEDFVQDNHSLSQKGVLRGLHFQTEPRAQAKLVRVMRGAAFDVAVDIRKDSETFGRYVSETLTAQNKKIMYIPKGFAHGFLALEDNTEFLYQVSDFYSPKNERGILWSDPAIGIRWPKIDGDYIFSDKDTKYPALDRIRDSF